MEVQKAARTYQLVEARPTTVVIHCSDPRFQKPFAEFIHEELRLAQGDYIPLVVSGGVASLSEPLRLPKEFKFMKERIAFFLELFDTVTKIVLINHEDCRHYEMLSSLLGKLFTRGSQQMIERQVNDLKAVAKMLLPYIRPGLQIEMYYARFVPGGERQVTFERVGQK